MFHLIDLGRMHNFPKFSSANLSESYFTNRQDRYILIENCRSLTDFYCQVIKNVGENSFQLSIDSISSQIKISHADHPNFHHPFLGR